MTRTCIFLCSTIRFLMLQSKQVCLCCFFSLFDGCLVVWPLSLSLSLFLPLSLSLCCCSPVSLYPGVLINLTVNVCVTLHGVDVRRLHSTHIEMIDDTNANAFTAWQQMGEPMYPTEK